MGLCLKILNGKHFGMKNSFGLVVGDGWIKNGRSKSCGNCIGATCKNY